MVFIIDAKRLSLLHASLAGKMAKHTKKPAPEARVWSCHLFVYFCHHSLHKSSLVASPVEFGSGRRSKGQPVPQVARDTWAHWVQCRTWQWFQQGCAVGCFGMKKKKKTLLGGEEGRAQPSWLVLALTPCGLRHGIAALHRKMKMPVKYLLEAIQA